MKIIKEEVFTFNGTNVTYKFRESKYDRKFLIIIFSGFRPTGSQYDLDGKGSDALAANLLWIKDSFNNSPSYYIRNADGFNIAHAIQELIAKISAELGLDKKHCLIAGFSKGGSGALYHGLKFNFPNILATVPRMNIGSANQLERPELLKSLLPEISSENVHALDSLIPDLLQHDSNRSRNIYLISSEQDEQYESEVLPYLNLYSGYSNFNFILTSSPLVKQHTDVTRYNLSAIYAIMSLLTDGVIPRFGHVRNGLNEHRSTLPQPSLSEIRDKNDCVGEFSRLSVELGRLYPEGHAFLRGHEASSHSNIQVSLSFDNGDVTSKSALGTVRNPHISQRYFQNQYCDYSYAGFASPKHQGIDISSLPLGVNNLQLNIIHNGQSAIVEPSSSRPINSWHVFDVNLLHVTSDHNGAKIVKRPSLGMHSRDTIFNLVALKLEASRLLIEGYFIQPGFPAGEYGDVVYYLVLCDVHSHTPQTVIPLASANKSKISEIVQDDYNNYSKSYFATLNYKGVDLGNTPAGDYEIHVTARFGTAIFSIDTGRVISVGESFEIH